MSKIILCSGDNHVFLWAGNAFEIPDGWFCTCGEETWMVKSEICTCTHDVYDNPNNPGHCMACGKPFKVHR